MILLRENKLFRFVAVLLLVGLAAFALHFSIHATHHAGDKDDADHCPVCQFIAALGFVLFCIFALFFRLQRVRFQTPSFNKFSSAGILSSVYGRAPPVLS